MSRESIHPALPAMAHRSTTPILAALLSAVLLTCVAGCKSRGDSAPTDATMASQLGSQLGADSALGGQAIQGSVQNGVATLNGTVANDAQRTIAARDAASVQGVREVVNNLIIAPPSATAFAPAPAPLPIQQQKTSALLPQPRPEPRNVAPSRQPAPITRQTPDRYTPPPPQNAYNPPAPPPQPIQRAPPQPVFRNVTVPAGTVLPVRVTQTLDSATTQTGDSFSGVVASDVVIDGLVAIPQGSAVTGNVDAVQEAAHFKGNSLLTVSLTGIRSRGERLPLTSDPYSIQGKGRGKNTAEKAGGGAAVGAILGGIFGGGKGAAIGAAAGGGAGAGANAVTRGQQVQIPSETVVRFHTSSPVNVRVRTGEGAHSDGENPDPGLEHRPG